MLPIQYSPLRDAQFLKLLRITLSVGTATALAILFFVIASDATGAVFYRRIISVSLGALVAGISLFLLQRNAAFAAAKFLIVGIWAMATFVGLITEGPLTPALTLYPITVIISGWLFGNRFAFRLIAASIMALFAMAVMQHMNWLLLPSPLPPHLAFASHLIFLLIAFAIHWGIVRGSQQHFETEARLRTESDSSQAELEKSHRLVMEQNEVLNLYRNAAEQENRLASDLINRLTHQQAFRDRRVRYWHRPASDFAGDIVATFSGKDGHLYILLGDATSHGLSAAICAIPILPLFFRLAEEDRPLSEIVIALNQSLLNVLPTDRFVAAALAVFYSQQQELHLWQAGLPEVLQTNSNGVVKGRYPSSHFALGIEDIPAASAIPLTVRYEPQDQFIFYSDGLIEAENDQGESFSEDRLVQALAHEGEADLIQSVRSALESHLAGDLPEDDITLLQVDCGAPPGAPSAS